MKLKHFFNYKLCDQKFHTFQFSNCFFSSLLMFASLFILRHLFSSHPHSSFSFPFPAHNFSTRHPFSFFLPLPHSLLSSHFPLSHFSPSSFKCFSPSLSNIFFPSHLISPLPHSSFSSPSLSPFFFPLPSPSFLFPFLPSFFLPLSFS